MLRHYHFNRPNVRCILCVNSFVFAILVSSIDTVDAQVVQLPTTGTFSIQSSVSVPDSGAAYLGGNRAGAMGRQSRGSLGPAGSTAYGSQMSSAAASVRATIIDLDELDRLIRSQAGAKAAIPNLTTESVRPPMRMSDSTRQPIPIASYEYLAALSHDEKVAPERVSEDTRYYLSLAAGARQKGHWHAVELYYKLAWESLPVERRENALVALANARSSSEKSNTKSESKPSNAGYSNAGYSNSPRNDKSKD